VKAQHAGGEGAARRVIAMKHQNSIQDQVRQEADRGEGQDGRGAVKFLAEVDRFGQQIEKGDANHRARAEPQNQMQFIAQPQRQQTAEKRTDERRSGDDYEQHG
jgi:hypothetical protein